MRRIGTSFLLFSLLGTATCSAMTLQNAIQETFNVNHEILSNKYNTEAQQKAYEEKRSGFLPSVDLSNDMQKSKRKNSYKDSTSDNIDINGDKATLSVEQLLYDGGKTSSMVGEAESNYWSSVYDANYKNGEVVLKVAKSYLQLASATEAETILNYNKKAHARGLDIASNNEQISGELLETKKVHSMITTLDDKIITNENQKDEARNEFTKLTRIEKIDSLCRPIIDESLVPKSLDEFLSIVMSNSPKIKEQEKNIEKQSEKIKQVLSRYQPNLKLKVEGVHDKDIELAEKGTQDELIGKLVLNWNFYSGGGDDLALQKERLFLIKEKEILEKTKADEIEKIKNIYFDYINTKNRIANLKKTLAMDIDILKITHQQLEDGSKTFFDELSAKSKVYDSQTNLIKQEYKFIENYFNVISQTGALSDFIQNSANKNCNAQIVEDLTQSNTPKIVDKKGKKKSDDDLLLRSLGSDDSSSKDLKVSDSKPTKTKTSTNSLESDFSDLFKKAGIEYNENNLSTTMKFTPDLFTVKAVNQSDKDISKLDAMLDNLIELISMHNGKIGDIEIELHTALDNNSVIENEKLSQRRAEKVKKYLASKISKSDVNSKTVNVTAIGKGSSELIFKNDVEDKDASTRIVIKLLKK